MARGAGRAGRVDAFGARVDTHRLAGWAIAAVGGGLLAATVLAWHLTDVATFDAAVVALPAAGTVAAWPLLRRSDLTPRRYPTVLRATVFGGLLLGGFIAAVLAVQGTTVAEAAPLVVFLAGVGCVSGVLVGTNQAQSRRARERAAAVRAERERLRFLNHLLRHNVLNKANVIQGTADLAAADADDADSHLETISRQTQDVVDLIESIRVLVTAAGGDTERRPVDLTADLRAEVRSVRRSHEDAEIRLDAPSDCTVLADDLVRYVFENLLHNAVVHAGDDPVVDVSCRHEGDWVVVTVADDGPGIPPARRETVFDPEVGTNHGLGLHLVRTLVDQYGGTVSIDDADLGGTAVTVRLPAAD